MAFSVSTRRPRCVRLEATITAHPSTHLLRVVTHGVLERLEKLAHGITARRSDSKRFTTPASWLRTRPTVATASASVGVLANQWDRRREFNRLPMDRTRRCVGMPCSMYSIASLTDDR